MNIINDIKRLPDFLVSTFYSRSIAYDIQVQKEEIVEKLNTLFTQNSKVFSSPNLYGNFTEYPDSFLLKPKWSMIAIKNFEHDPAYLSGTLSVTENGGTKIEVELRPNSVFGILFIVFTLFALYHLYKYFLPSGTNNNLFICLFVIVIMVPILCAIAGTASHSLKKNFEKYLEIEQEENK